jgi:flap endonuclease-1
MGIKDLYKVLASECPKAVVDNVRLEKLFGVVIAVDVSIFLNKFVKSAGPDRWVDSFVIFICMLKKYGTKPLFIFDGPNPPIEKKAEQEQRRKTAAAIKVKIEQGKKLLIKIEKNYLETGKRLDENTIAEVKSIVGKSEKNINFFSTRDVYNGLKDSVESKERQNMPILPIYSDIAKELITAMGLAYFQAEGEAETLCAILVTNGFADAAMSEDTDVLAYGTQYLISRIDFSKQTVSIVSHAAILEGMDMTHAEFQDLCILLRCDYNKLNGSVKGYPPDDKKRKKPIGIGTKGAVLMIKEYRRLEEVEKHVDDISPLIYRRCREIFCPRYTGIDIEVPYSLPIDRKRLSKFIETYNIKTGMQYILDTWKPTAVLIFGDTEDRDEEVISDCDSESDCDSGSEQEEDDPKEVELDLSSDEDRYTDTVDKVFKTTKFTPRGKKTKFEQPKIPSKRIV